jgi:hypothetical protein
MSSPTSLVVVVRGPANVTYLPAASARAFLELFNAIFTIDPSLLSIKVKT